MIECLRFVPEECKKSIMDSEYGKKEFTFEDNT